MATQDRTPTRTPRILVPPPDGAATPSVAPTTPPVTLYEAQGRLQAMDWRLRALEARKRVMAGYDE